MNRRCDTSLDGFALTTEKIRNGRRTSPETGEDVDAGTVLGDGGRLRASDEVERWRVGIDGLCFSVGSDDGEM